MTSQLSFIVVVVVVAEVDVIDEDGVVVVDGVVAVDPLVEFGDGDVSVDVCKQPPQKCPAIYGNKLYVEYWIIVSNTYVFT